MTTQIVGVAKTAQRQRLAFGRADFAGKAQGLLVFFETTVDIAEREVNVATQAMDLSALGYKALAHRRSFRLFKDFQSRVLLIGDTQTFRHADPRPTNAYVVRS